MYGLSLVSLELVGGSLHPIHGLQVPRGVHWRKLIFIGFQGQSKIRQGRCRLHDSVVKFTNIHVIIHYQPLPTIIKRSQKDIIFNYHLKIQLTAPGSIGHGLSEPCLKYLLEFSQRDTSWFPKAADFWTDNKNDN